MPHRMLLLSLLSLLLYTSVRAEANCTRPTLLGGTVSPANSSLPVGATFLVHCDVGFTASGSRLITCQPDGTFDEVPTCAPLLEEVVREFHTLDIDCGSDRTILINNADYGIEVHHNGGDECSASSALTEITAACAGQNECSVPASNAEFGNPCPWVIKQLTVIYSCHANCTLGISAHYASTDLRYDSAAGTVTALPAVEDSTLIRNTTENVTFTAEVEVSRGIEFETSLPLVTNGTVTQELSPSYQFQTGATRSVRKTFPNSACESCAAYLYRYAVSVPYVQTWQHSSLGKECKVRGVLREEVVELRVEQDGEETVVEGSGGLAILVV